MNQTPNRQTAPTSQHWQVVVIGAGVAGAMAALLASRAGLRTLLIERQLFPRHKVCGCCLNATAINELNQVGLLPSVYSHSANSISIARFHYDGRSAAIPTQPGLAISRYRLDQLLVEAAQQSGCTFIDQTTATVVPDAALPDAVDGQWCVAETSSNTRRVVLQSAGGGNGIHSTDPRTIEAKVILVCDGLGHPSLKHCDGIKSSVSAGSRVGVGVVIPRTTADGHFRSGEIQMAVSRYGYVGTVEIEPDLLNVAAAVDAGFLRSQDSPSAALQTICREAGLTAPAALEGAHVRGTVPLSRTSFPLAERRLFLLGDAAGYVEPFTGEGIAWSMVSASSVMPLLQQTVESGWLPDRIREWQQIYDRKIGRRQRICRLLSSSLRHPWLLSPMLSACRIAPSIAAGLVNRMNRVSVSKVVR